MSSLAHMVLRSVEIVLGVIILGLSSSLVATQAFGGAPSATNFNVFVGIWITAIALVGLAARFTSITTVVVMTALDALSVLFALAGGAAYATQLGVSSCACSDVNSSCSYLVNNDIINGGVNKVGQVNLSTDRVHRCQMAQADAAFIWLAFVCFFGSFLPNFMTWRRGGKF